VPFKPDGYNSVSPYLVVPGAQQLIDFLERVFNARVTRRYDNPDGTIMHAEVRIDDSIVMLGDSSPTYAPNTLLIHIYVPNVDEVFEQAQAAGATEEQAPQQRPGDPDRRGSFKDFAGNTWAVATQR
jgi:PhnB protein